MNASHNNGALGRHLRDICRQSQKRRQMRLLGLWCCAAALMLLAMLVAGCASQVPTPCEPPKPIPPPAVHQPWSTTSYSEQLAMKLKDWQSKLTYGSQTQKH